MRLSDLWPNTPHLWFAASESVQGTAHVAQGVPNQDRGSAEPGGQSRLPIILAVADGHGDARHFRSWRGAELALIHGMLALRQFTHRAPAEKITLSRLRHQTRGDLPKRIVADWTKAVYADLDRRPLTREELDDLRTKRGEKVAQAVTDNPIIAYGTTFLGVVIAPSYCVVAQIGDGDILVADINGTIGRPLADTSRDDNADWSLTESLSDENASSEFQMELIPREAMDPAFVMLSTDGLRKATADEQGFRQVVSDIAKAVRQDGIDSFRQELAGVLRRMSGIGDGDDVTLAFAYDQRALNNRGWNPTVARHQAPQLSEIDRVVGTVVDGAVHRHRTGRSVGWWRR